MINIIDKKKCSGCGACANICPKKCISMEQDSEGFFYPKVDKEKCINCGLCDSVCCVDKKIQSNEPTASLAHNRNEEIRSTSSSGGIFSVLAEHILKENGIVYGAALQKDMTVKHIKVDDINDLELLRGAKYVQSETGYCYTEIKENLEEGKRVLFSGTPCQISGLKSFLKKNYENLLLVGIVCHGVASPKVFKAYLNYGIKAKDGDITRISFRDKVTGWKNYSVTIIKKNKPMSKLHDDCSYMRGYLAGLYSRPSCHECNWKKMCDADIILGDAWGVQYIMPEFDDDNGTSLVLLYSQKGKKIFEELQNMFYVVNVEYKDFFKYNPAIEKSKEGHKNRADFFEKFNYNPKKINSLIWKYSHEKLLLYIKIKVARMLKLQ